MTVNAGLLELGPANVYLFILPAAFLETAQGTPKDLRVEAKKGGVAGNSITLALVIAGANQVLSVSVSGTAISVNLATSGASASTSTAKDVRDAINNHAGARGLVKAMFKSGQDGTGVMGAAGSVALAGGSDTGVATDVGFVDEGLAVRIATTASPKTGAQTGTFAQGKVITGGSVQITVPFKEISMENIQRGIPNAILYDNGVKKRVEFVARVGLDMRDLAQKMEIRKIIGGAETTLPKDILVIPLASPGESDVTIPFHPINQRVIPATFDAWPDANGLIAFWGDGPTVF